MLSGQKRAKLRILTKQRETFAKVNLEIGSTVETVLEMNIFICSIERHITGSIDKDSTQH